MSTIKGRNIRKRALLVGIDEYQNPANNLRGCVNDAIDMAETLKICGTPATRIKMITNQQATKEGILKGLDWLTKDITDNDVITFFFSGHGSQVADLNDDEHDRLDEILCTHDLDWNKKLYITDDDLHDYFTSKLPPTVRTDVIIDTCHAGTMTRSLAGADHADNTINIHSPIAYHQQRYLTPPIDHEFRLHSMLPQFTEIHHIGDRSIIQDKKHQFNVLWAACLENQVAWEMRLSGQIRGVFTYHLCKVLRGSDGNISRLQGYGVLRSTMRNNGFSQTPDLEVPHTDALDIFPFRKINERDQDRGMKK